ncbi:MAG: amino acid permease [Pirellulaceae bacterium]|jgi:APA family basic amino acid/polyamine antiporter|nr:amino acid permease [Pirellulaceae bacterium]
MRWRQFFRRKPLEILLAEMAGEHRLHRVLGPVSLTSLGVGAIIGAGIFAMTGRVAAEDAGPAVVVSFMIAGVACMLAAFCYSEFAAMAPVAGSAYTYTYATLGELWAWIIGWDLVLEYAMSCSVVAAHWSHYLDEFLWISFGWNIPPQFLSDPFTPVLVQGVPVQAYVNLPAILIMAVITAILVVGIRESALTNAVLVIIKLVVVLFVVVLGWRYVDSWNWTSVPVEQRQVSDVTDYLERHPAVAAQVPPGTVGPLTSGTALLEQHPELAASLSSAEQLAVQQLPHEAHKWGLLGVLGVRQWLQPLDEAIRSPFFPYGFSGLMIGAALVFFAYIGFDSISTHAEEAVRPQRDVPIGILASLVICTVLYVLVSGVITGMEPYPEIDLEASVAAAFRKRAELDSSPLLQASAWVIAAGALAGMSSVLLVTFLSQARIFLAMARDGLLPHSIFGVVHSRFRTPHRSTLLTGAAICLVSGILPIRLLEEMVSIGTLMAFVLVCASVLLLRITRPDVHRPFRCPAVYLVAPLGVLVNLAMMAFLPIDTWLRLVIWLALGLAIYLGYGYRHSRMGHELQRQMQTQGLSPTDAPLTS